MLRGRLSTTASLASQRAAGFASLWSFLESSLLVELLLPGGEDKGLPTVDAFDG